MAPAPRLDESTLAASPSGGDAGEPGIRFETAKAPKRPVIRSFGHTVMPHIPLRSTLSDQGVIAISPPPPPTILSILPEGTRVRDRDVVCELDSSAFRQAVAVQQLRYLRAKAWVEQAGFILEASQIALREYQDGILPQDIQLVRNYIEICETDRDRAARNLAWARTAFAKGFRTQGQVEAEAARFELAGITLRDAQGMLRRLIKYTGKRILKAHHAKVEAIQADRLSLESSFRLERERLERIDAMIAHCTMRAPHEGIVVYANRVNGWGTVETQIREGLRVYQSQPIFRLLDSRACTFRHGSTSRRSRECARVNRCGFTSTPIPTGCSRDRSPRSCLFPRSRRVRFRMFTPSSPTSGSSPAASLHCDRVSRPS